MSPSYQLFTYTTLFRSLIEAVSVMDSLYILIPIALLFVAITIGVFFFAVKSDQFEDLERQGMNILLDDQLQPPRSEEHTSELQSRPHLVCRLLLEKKK